MQTLCCSRPLLLAYLLSTPVELMPNAAPQPLPEADARDERTLEAVGCRRLFGRAAAPHPRTVGDAFPCLASTDSGACYKPPLRLHLCAPAHCLQKLHDLG